MVQTVSQKQFDKGRFRVTHTEQVDIPLTSFSFWVYPIRRCTWLRLFGHSSPATFGFLPTFPLHDLQNPITLHVNRSLTQPQINNQWNSGTPKHSDKLQLKLVPPTLFINWEVLHHPGFSFDNFSTPCEGCGLLYPVFLRWGPRTVAKLVY